MSIRQQLTESFQKAFKKLNFPQEYAVVGFSSRPELCEFQNNAAFKLAKELKKPPIEIAEKIASNVSVPGFEISVCPPAFVNIKVTNEKISEILTKLSEDVNLGVPKTSKKQRILIDYGGANVAKELHMGHLRSPIIGEALKRLYKLLGHEVISDAHLGDWGMQMGLTVAQLEEDGVLGFFFDGKGTAPEITLDMLNIAYPKASKRKNNEPSFKKKADNYTLFIQQKKEPYYKIYKAIRSASVSFIERNYAALKCHFDLWFGESDAESYIESTVKTFIDKGLAKRSEGALVVDVAKEGEHIPIPKKNPEDKQLYENPMPPAILKKYNDGDLYATTDLATIKMRNEDYRLDAIHYCADKRQSLHFEQVFRCAKLAELSPKTQELTFVGFGTMNGKDGKPFKTRDGETIKLEDIIHLIRETAKDRLIENEVSSKNMDTLALQIGVAAMKFGDLSNIVSKDYVFDINKFVSFEGKTGPYIQYTAARIQSMLKEIKDISSAEIKIETKEERAIFSCILKLIASFNMAFAEKSLHSICNATYELASSFAGLYATEKILKNPNNKRKLSLLKLSELVLKYIQLAFGVLAIDIPEKM